MRGHAAVWLGSTSPRVHPVTHPAVGPDQQEEEEDDQEDDQEDPDQLEEQNAAQAPAVAHAVVPPAQQQPKVQPYKAPPPQFKILPESVIHWYTRSMCAGRAPANKMHAMDLAEARVPLITGGFRNMWHYLADDLRALETASKRR